MTGKTVLWFVGFLAISQVYGEDLFETLKEDLLKAGEAVENQAAGAKVAFKGAVNQISNVPRDASHKVSRINGLFDRALNQVDSAPEQCKNDVKKNLVVLKSGHVGSFLTCSKLLEAGEDVVEVGMTTVDLVMDVVDIGRDVMMGFGGCFSSFWPWRIIECWYDRITTTYDDITRTIADIENYASKISDYAHNATILIEYCWDGTSAEADVLEVMKPLHQCTQQPIPYHLYKL